MEKVILDDFLNNCILSDLKISYGIGQGLMVKKTLDITDNEYKQEVLVLDLDSSGVRTLDTELNIKAYVVCKKGFLLMTYQSCKSQLFLYDGQTIEHLADILAKANEFAILGDQIFYTSEMCGDTSDIHESSEIPFLREGSTITGRSVKSLYKLDLNSGTTENLTSKDISLRLFRLSEEYGKIVFTASRNDSSNNAVSNIYTYDLMDKRVSQLTNGDYRIDGLEIVDCEYIAFEAVDLKQASRNDHQQVHWLNFSDGSITVESFLDMSNEVPSIHSDMVFSKGQSTKGLEGKFYSIRTEQFNQIITVHTFTDNYQKIQSELVAIYGFDIAGDSLWIIGAKAMGLTELYCYNASQLKQVTHNNDWLNQKTLSIPERVQVSSKGERIDGFVYPPISDDKTGAGVLMIHGGPKLMYGEIYNHDIQLLAAQGHYVFCANPKGSDGRGNDYLDIRGSYAEIPYDQLMDFTDHVCANYPIDSEKLGVSGGSYGGYMTNYIVTKTDRFKAAVSERGISNLMSAMTSSDIGMEYTMEYMKGNTPWQDLDMYIKASPIYKADQVKTPVLFNHGKDDYRCLYTESLNFYSSLRHFKVESKLCIYPGENHGLVLAGRPRSKKKRYEEVLNWFMTYLKGAN